jgi:hypothetical protein
MPNKAVCLSRHVIHSRGAQLLTSTSPTTHSITDLDVKSKSEADCIKAMGT